jgi:hypothetical protein
MLYTNCIRYHFYSVLKKKELFQEIKINGTSILYVIMKEVRTFCNNEYSLDHKRKRHLSKSQIIWKDSEDGCLLDCYDV